MKGRNKQNYMLRTGCSQLTTDHSVTHQGNYKVAAGSSKTGRVTEWNRSGHPGIFMLGERHLQFQTIQTSFQKCCLQGQLIAPLGTFTLDDGPVGLLFTDDNRFTQSMNDQPLTMLKMSSRALCINHCWWSQYKTALHWYSDYLVHTSINNVINPVMVLLHEQHRSSFIFMDFNASAS